MSGDLILVSLRSPLRPSGVRDSTVTLEICNREYVYVIVTVKVVQVSVIKLLFIYLHNEGTSMP